MTLYSIEEVAKMFRVCKETVRRWIKEDRLKAIKIGKTVRITEDSINHMLTNGLTERED